VEILLQIGQLSFTHAVIGGVFVPLYPGNNAPITQFHPMSYRLNIMTYLFRLSCSDCRKLK